MTLLQYRAGPRALARIRREGFGPHNLRMLLAPAAGPKWLAVMGLDQALIEGGFLSRGEDAGERGEKAVTLVGASAGAWRAFALGARDPAKTHRALCDDYIQQRFTLEDDATTISRAYRALLRRVFSDEDIAHALDHRQLTLALLVARARGLTGASRKPVQLTALGTAALFHAVSRRSQPLFFDRTLFTSAPIDAPSLGSLRGRRVPLSLDNAREALLASGSVPLVMAPVDSPPGAPRGRYLDGGLTDYHVAQPIEVPDGIAALFLHQRRVTPHWFDKHLPYRRPRPGDMQDVLQIHPSDAWIASLPGGAVPTREDFQTFVDAPEARIGRWREAVARSEQLGEQLLSDAHSGRLADLVQPL